MGSVLRSTFTGAPIIPGVSTTLLLFTLSARTARRYSEIGFLIGGVGAIVVTLGALIGFFTTRGGGKSYRQIERIARVLGALLIGAGFLLALVAVHYGPLSGR